MAQNQSDKWRQYLVSNTGIDGKLNGLDVKYYPVSVGLTFKLRAFSKPISRLLAILNDRKSTDRTDTGSINRKVDKLQNGEGLNEYIIQPIAPELAAIRHTQHAEAIHDLVNGVAGEDAKKLLCELVMDSLRDIFPRGAVNPPNPPVEEIAGEMDFPLFCEALFYVAKANMGQFGPLLESAGINAQTLAEKLSRLGQEIKAPPAATTAATA